MCSIILLMITFVIFRYVEPMNHLTSIINRFANLAEGIYYLTKWSKLPILTPNVLGMYMLSYFLINNNCL